jgi:LexA DNA binding domain
MTSNVRSADTQRDILGCIRVFVKENGYAPTLSEIGRVLGLRSKATVLTHLRALREMELVSWVPGQERTLFLPPEGGANDARRLRRHLMRTVLGRPDVRAAIQELLTTRGFRPDDAARLHVAYIKGEVNEFRLNRHGQVEKRKLLPCWPALRAYWRLCFGL